MLRKEGADYFVPSIKIAIPYARVVEHSLVRRMREAGDARELLHCLFFPPGTNAHLGFIEFVVASEHR